MDKAQALHAFWSSFGWTAIDENSAYDTKIDLGDRYITYEVATSNVLDTVALSASLWERSTSWVDIQRKADEIASYIGYGGVTMQVEDGYIWVKLGTPFAQRMSDDSKNDIRRIYLNIAVDFLTAT